MKKKYWIITVCLFVIIVLTLLLYPFFNQAKSRSVRVNSGQDEQRRESQDAFIAASRLWRVEQRLDEAEVQLKELAEQQPDDVFIWKELAQLYRQQQNDDLEHNALDQIVNPQGNWGSSLESDPRLLSRFMLLSESLGETAKFLSARESLFGIGPIVVGSHLPIVEGRRTGTEAEITSRALTIAGARLAKGHTFRADAVPLLEEALDRDPNNDMAAFYLGYVYREEKMKEASIAMFEKALDISQDEIVIRESIRLLRAMGAETVAQP